MKKNIAVVGCGYWGKNLVRNFSELGALYSVSDANIETAKNYANQYQVKSLTFDETINNKDIDHIFGKGNACEIISNFFRSLKK